jgi:hypothetical protein
LITVLNSRRFSSGQSRGGGFIGEVKQRDNFEPITVTQGNRDRLPSDLATRIRTR